MLASFIFISALAAIIYYIHRYKNRRFDKLIGQIPSSPSLPVLGHALYFWKLDEMLHNANKMLVEHNGVCSVCVHWIKFVLVSDSELTAKLCTSNQVKKCNKLYRFFEDWLGINIFTAENALWKKYRSILTPVFRLENLEQYIHGYNLSAHTLIASMKDVVGKPIDVHKYVEVWSIQMILEINMKLPLGSLNYANNIREMTKIMATRITNPLKFYDFLFRFTRDYKKQRKAINSMKTQVKLIMEQKFQATNERVSKVELIENKAQSILELFNENRGVNLNDDEICNHLQAVLFAGYDTSATAVACTLYMLSIHEDVQEKAYSEIRDILDREDKSKGCTLEDIKKMSYLEMVIKETMRLYPPVPLLAKHTLEDFNFRNYLIPKGADILIFIDSIHKNEKYYPNPLVFDPERFAPENQVNMKRFTYIPFGAGQRNCLGQKVAMMAMKTVIAMILRNYKLLPVEGFHMKLFNYIIQKPSEDGIQVKLEEREN